MLVYQRVYIMVLPVLMELQMNLTFQEVMNFMDGAHTLRCLDLWREKRLVNNSGVVTEMCGADNWVEMFTYVYHSPAPGTMHRHRFVMIWRFPTMGVPPNHPFLSGFPWNEPSSYWGTPILGSSLFRKSTNHQHPWRQGRYRWSVVDAGTAGSQAPRETGKTAVTHGDAVFTQ